MVTGWIILPCLGPRLVSYSLGDCLLQTLNLVTKIEICSLSACLKITQVLELDGKEEERKQSKLQLGFEPVSRISIVQCLTT